jgi:hypothetical protein
MEYIPTFTYGEMLQKWEQKVALTFSQPINQTCIQITSCVYEVKTGLIKKHWKNKETSQQTKH